LSAAPQPRRHFWRAVGIVVLGLLAMALGAMVGSGSALQNYVDYSQPCEIPAGSAVTQTISFPNNQPDHPGNSTVTATLPSSSRYARVLAGLSGPRKERLVALQCVFGTVPTSPADITQKGNVTSFTTRTDYIAYGILDPPSVVADGLRLTAPTYVFPGSYGWPAGTKVTLQVKAPGRQIMYSQPPLQRDAGMLTWTWALTKADVSGGNRPNPVSITVPLGIGEHVTALTQRLIHGHDHQASCATSPLVRA
jgi:hypothetical protein